MDRLLRIFLTGVNCSSFDYEFDIQDEVLLCSVTSLDTDEEVTVEFTYDGVFVDEEPLSLTHLRYHERILEDFV